MSVLRLFAGDVVGRPHFLLPEKAEMIASALDSRIDLGPLPSFPATGLPAGALSSLLGQPSARFDGAAEEIDPATGERRRAPYRVANGVAIVSVIGTLVNRGSWIGASSGLTSYEGVSHQLETAAASSAVRSIILDVQSPGGQGAGAMELAAVVRRIATVKPVVAVVDSMAASAGYGMISGATRIVTIPSGMLGSIGVVYLHQETSRKDDREGVTKTLIFAGGHKVDGNQHQPLAPEARASIQATVDRYYDLFVDAVAAGRKNLTPEAIRATEADVFVGADAIERGLADEIGTFADVLADLSKPTPGPRRPQPKGKTMDPNAETGDAVVRADHDRAVNAARSEGAQAERDRVKAIMALDEAQGRQASAQHLALSTDLSAEQCKPLLAGLPKDSAAGAAAAAAAIDPQTRSQGAAGGLVTATDPAGAQPHADGGRSIWAKTIERQNAGVRRSN